MRLSVVIPTRNNSSDLKKCLESLEQQSKKPFEKIIVDGHSTDITLQIAEDFGCRIACDDEIKIGNAYFVGASSAKGDIVVFIDDDAMAPDSLLEKIKEFLSKNPDIDILGGEDLINTDATEFQKAAYQIDLISRPKGPVSGDASWRWLRAACIAYRKLALEKFSFDPRLSGLQEPELHERMRKAGLKAIFDPSIYVYHRRRNSLGGIWNQIYRNGKAKIDLLRMHPNMLSFYDIVPLLSIILTITSIYLGHLEIWFSIILLYFFIKPLIILIKTGNLRYYPLLVMIIFTREIAYSSGIVVGLLFKWKRLK